MKIIFCVKKDFTNEVDDEKNYTVKSNQLFRSRKYGNGNKKIEATTISGDIDIDFE